MDELKIFENKEFGNIRELEINGEPWFVGKDVATALGYENPSKAIRDHVYDEDKVMVVQNVTPSIADSKGRTQYPTWINESGMYSLIFGSKLESAKRFKHWVTSEVLPSIRKTGTYGLGEVDASIGEFMKQQMETNRMQAEFNKKMMEFMAAKQDSLSLGSGGNPFNPGGDVIKERMANLNALVDQTSELCGLERNKTLHYMYQVIQEKMGVNLKSYLNVFQSEAQDGSLCNLHVICKIDRFYNMAVEMNKDVIERKRIYG